MRNLVLILFTSYMFFSCIKNDSVKKHYSNGNIKAIYFFDKKGLKKGEYLEYYRSGNLKLRAFYMKGKRVKTAFYYFDEKIKKIKTAIYYNDSLSKQIFYHKNGNIKAEGKIYRDSIKIGHWNYYDSLGVNSEIIEFKNIKGNSYLNQNWKLNNKGDTIGGHHYELIMKDTVKLKELLRVRFFLSSPLLSNESNLYVCLPKKGYKLNNNFSNWNKIKYDTFNNVALIYKQKNLYQDGNHDVIFDLKHSRKGKKILKGFLMEKAKSIKDSFDFVTRNIYFNIPYFIE